MVWEGEEDRVRVPVEDGVDVGDAVFVLDGVKVTEAVCVKLGLCVTEFVCDWLLVWDVEGV